MPAQIIDGAAIARQLRELVAAEVSKLKATKGVTPGLAVVLVGENPASQVYVKSKSKQAAETGIKAIDHRLSETTTEAELLSLVQKLNADPAVHGILVQLPLPSQIRSAEILRAIDPAKDVDGFHPINVGLLATAQLEHALVPCTPLGSLILLKRHLGTIEGLNALVIGRSNIVGRPMVQLLLNESCTVEIAHSKTDDLPAHCRRADIVVAAIGKPEFVRGDWIRPGATVIDVGINRIAGSEGKTKLVGDVAFEEASKIAGAITPVPGGVGPMTIACLLANTLTSACRHAGVKAPEWTKAIRA